MTIAWRIGTSIMRRCIDAEQCLDFSCSDIRLPAAIRKLANTITHGPQVYIHCTAGLGGAPVVVLEYFLLVESTLRIYSLRGANTLA
jgi:hypothetical protein